jgi:hypothetical protein
MNPYPNYLWVAAFCSPEWNCVVVILTVRELSQKGLKNQVVRPWLKRQVVRPVSDSLQVRECAEEGESSWKEPCSCHRARRFLVRSVVEAQGKGG